MITNIVNESFSIVFPFLLTCQQKKEITKENLSAVFVSTYLIRLITCNYTCAKQNFYIYRLISSSKIIRAELNTTEGKRNHHFTAEIFFKYFSY